MIAQRRHGLDDRWLSVTTPTTFTRWWRVFIPWQMFRFVWLNLKMVEIIIKGHH